MLRRTARCLSLPLYNKWGAMSDYDPRVVYSKEPWNNPLKQTTGLSGLSVDHRWRQKLITLYTSILEEAKMIPEDTVYRQSVENIYREFLRIVTNVGDTDWAIVERKIGLGQVEQLILKAMDERELVQAYADWKLWLIPVEAVREMQEEMKADVYFDFAGPPEPYLSDSEINELKKVDQQRMAEEQKMIQQDLKKLAGRTSRMREEDRMARMQKKEEYNEAIREYIRETSLDRQFTLRSDGSVDDLGSGPHSSSVVTPNVTDTSTKSSFNVDPQRRKEVFTDWQETNTYLRGSPRGPQTPTKWGKDGKPFYKPETVIPMRLHMWEAEKGGVVDKANITTDLPRGAPVAKGAPRGKLIPKWKKVDVESLRTAPEAMRPKDDVE
eukprot:Sspe_Gene.38031::Locus_18342_Transcript_1_1_Confidence_1.000_Length_1239::g.38031::m.38031